MGIKHNVFIISGPSGSGKGTVIDLLPSNFKKAVSVTTRAPRQGEVEGVDYFFISESEFIRLRDNNMLAEWNHYGDNYYGTPVSQIEDMHSHDMVAVLDIDVNGADQIKRLYPDVPLVFLIVRSANEQVKRLRGRNTNTEADIRKRIKVTKRELERINDYDRVFINDDGKSRETADNIAAYINGDEVCEYDKACIDSLIRDYFLDCPEAAE